MTAPITAPVANWRATLDAGARFAVGVLATIAGCALLVATTAPGAARHLLAFPFAGVPPTAGEARAIFTHNLRVLASVIGLLLIAQGPPQAGVPAGRIVGAVRCVGEVVIAGVAAANVLEIGAALGAYGAAMAHALLPHGPVELAAYALALGLYQRGRRSRLSGPHAIAVLACSVALLALAAALEAFVSL